MPRKRPVHPSAGWTKVIEHCIIARFCSREDIVTAVEELSYQYVAMLEKDQGATRAMLGLEDDYTTKGKLQEHVCEQEEEIEAKGPHVEKIYITYHNFDEAILTNQGGRGGVFMLLLYKKAK